MNTREQFGSYILLKKLSEDALGETFRAGRFGSQGIEQVVLLRVFNGQGLDGPALWQKVADRKELAGGLRSPNLAAGIDFGELQGVPYVAYDYISGKNLARLQEQANRQLSPLPPDHALLIIERMALGLTAALETRLGGERVLHGFVVPDLVMVSNEGEAKLLGFEAAPGLRDMAASNAAVRSFERYLAPEALAGQPPHRSDDVYSLGVILYELLTGETMPAGVADHNSLLEQAQIASESEPVPPGIRQLLQRSLASREQRIGDAASWHKALSQVMMEGQYNPTTFNLAFFMHSLFRDEIEKESRELQSEQKIEPPTATAEMEAASSGGGREPGADTVMVSSADIEPEAGEESGSKKGLYFGLAAVATLVLVAAVLYVFVFGAKTSAPPEPAEPAAQVPPPVIPPPQEEEVPSGPTQEEIQAELERMREEMAESLAAQNQEMQEELAARYESRLADLQDQYEQAQKEAEERKAAEEQAQKEAEALAEQQAAEEAAQKEA
ncbi:MAG: protein kinase, partial [Acidobacteriota bacterium]|nr:protein kinase [Acidobacteriota bacterium]